MNSRILKLLVAVLLFVSCAYRVNAQGGIATVPYSCDFENAVERTQWVLLNGTQTNKWYVDTATSCGGDYSLYISNTGGTVYEYDPAVASSTWAYRQIAIVAGLYNISYNWKGQGYSTTHYMRAYLVPASQFNGSAGSATGFQTSGHPTGWIPIDATYPTGSYMNQQSTCRNVYLGNVSVPSTGNYYLVFGWTNNAYNVQGLQPPAAIDDIQITTATCPRPDNLSVRTISSNGTAEATWTETGTATMWLLEYSTSPNFRPATSIIVTNPVGATGTVSSGPLPGFQQSTAYYFRVRAICDTTFGNGDTSMTSLVYNYRFCSGNVGCIDFTNLRARDVTCTYGTYQYYQQYTANYPGPYANHGVVDLGSGSYGRASNQPGSRHTVNRDPNAVDPIFPQISKIPPNECESVRLGSLYGGYICQSVSYQLLVDSAQADILLFKYACVFNDVGHTPSTIQPRFVLEILDQQGNLISPNCGAADFNATDVTSGTVGGTWYSRQGSITYVDTIVDSNTGAVNCSTMTFSTYSNGLRGRDWTPMGLNIAQYHGQTITVRITSFNCGQSGPNHCGYVYYTLGCTKGRITSNSCGGGSVSTTLTAPSGFNYRWYTARNPNQVVSRQQTVTVQVDSTMYYCDVSFVDDSSCHFTLSTFVSQRYPRASFTASMSTDSCMYRLRLHNTSRITSTLTDTNSIGACESYFWDFGNGQTSTAENPTVTYSQPGTYTVKLIAQINNRECGDTIVHQYTFRPHVPGRLVAPRRVCYGDTAFLRAASRGYVEYRWNTGYQRDSLYVVPDSTTQYTLIARDSIGCVDTMRATVAITDCNIYDTVCRNERYLSYGFNIPASTLRNFADTLVVFERHTRSHFGVDSITILNLLVWDTNETVTYDTFCFGDPYSFYNIPLTRGGRYAQRFTNIHGCDSIIYLELEELPRPTLELHHSYVPCFNYPITLIANRTGGDWIRWTSSPIDTSMSGYETQDTLVVRPHQRTIYTAVTGRDNYPCTTSAQTIVNLETDLKAYIHTSQEAANYENMQVIFSDRSTDNTGRRWYLRDFNLPVGTDENYIYTFEAREDSVKVILVAYIEGTECLDTTSVTIPLFKDAIWVPNAFTPDEDVEDSKNKVFYVMGVELIEFEMDIFNRNGYRVFHLDELPTKDWRPGKGNHWNGGMNNDPSRPCVTGNYTYRIVYKTKSQPDRTFTKVGSVLLIR